MEGKEEGEGIQSLMEGAWRELINVTFYCDPPIFVHSNCHGLPPVVVPLLPIHLVVPLLVVNCKIEG